VIDAVPPQHPGALFDREIAKVQPRIDSILESYGVPLVKR
jgi:hypothetical protein